jgi:hypothetical protein
VVDKAPSRWLVSGESAELSSFLLYCDMSLSITTTIELFGHRSTCKFLLTVRLLNDIQI